MALTELDIAEIARGLREDAVRIEQKAIKGELAADRCNAAATAIAAALAVLELEWSLVLHRLSNELQSPA